MRNLREFYSKLKNPRRKVGGGKAFQPASLMLHRRTAAGFTLLEILIATAIFLVLIVALYSAYAQVIKTREITSFRGEEEFYTRLIVQRLNQELASMVFNPGGLASSFSGERDSLSFYTDAYSLYYPTNPLTRVSYFREEEKVYREEFPYLSLEKEEGKKFVILEKVEELEFSYFDGRRWQDKWERKDSLPLRVKMKIKVNGISYSTSFYLPLGGKIEK